MHEGKFSGFIEVENYISSILKTAAQNMTCLDKSYLEGSIQKKWQIIGLIFPEKVSFDKTKSRTGRINEADRLIYRMGNGFNEIKNRIQAEDCLNPVTWSRWENRIYN